MVSLHPGDQTTARIPASSQNSVTTHATHGRIDTSRTTFLSTLEPLESPSAPKSRASTSPPDAIPIEHFEGGRAPSLDVPLSPSPTRVHLTGPPLTLNIRVTGTDHSSFSESYPLMIAPSATDPSRQSLSSPPNVGAASQGEDSAMATLREEMDVLYPSSAIREDIIATPDLPPQPPPPPHVIDVAIAGLSLDGEDTGDHPQGPSRGRDHFV